MNTENQVTVFDLIEEKEKGEFNELIKKLEHYKVDERYRKEHQGKWHTFVTIQNDLESISEYDSYKKEMIQLLQTYYRDFKGVQIVYYDDLGYARINSSQTRSSYPIFCLEMIPEKDRINLEELYEK